MVYFLIYDVSNDVFLKNIVCATRTIANKWCDELENNRGGLFVPVKFVNGVQVGIV